MFNPAIVRSLFPEYFAATIERRVGRNALRAPCFADLETSCARQFEAISKLPPSWQLWSARIGLARGRVGGERSDSATSASSIAPAAQIASTTTLAGACRWRTLRHWLWAPALQLPGAHTRRLASAAQERRLPTLSRSAAVTGLLRASTRQSELLERRQMRLIRGLPLQSVCL